MVLQLSAEKLFRDAQRIVTAVPNRIRFLVGLLLCGATFFYFFDTPSVSVLGVKKPPKWTGYVHIEGGDWNFFENIFAFGDSWSATQFYSGGVQPNPDNPFGNPDLPKNGTSHPPNYLHYLTTTFNETFLRTFNMAHGAATVDREIIPPHEFLNWTHTFKEQVNDIYKPNYTSSNPVAQWNPAKTLFTVWFGVVDISLLIDRKLFKGDHVERVVESYGNILHELYETSARHFLLLTAPPMYLSPSAREEGHNPFLERISSKEFNGRLYIMRKEFVKQHPDATVYIFDTHGLMTRVIQDPNVTEITSTLKNTTDNCWEYNPDGYTDPKPWDWFLPSCAVPFDQYLWANHLHPTHIFHQAAAAAIVKDCFPGGGAKRSGYCS